ncbi:Auxin-repressed [Musa troglodytarum]|uniref:Auxin-repressed n=1 Tax=Musa troglodytarum TaxID=320322 RepID=A0A9E7K4T0_9LILI|nr:Auxin-repressed [Musa troglodytarum]
MSLLHHLWDDTVAGPLPDTGLGKLRKASSFSPSSLSAAAAAAAPVALQVTRSITILRDSASAAPPSPSSSAASSPRGPWSALDSPLSSPTPRGDWKRLRRKPTPVAEGVETAEPRSPTVYDWVVISSLDS